MKQQFKVVSLKNMSLFLSKFKEDFKMKKSIYKNYDELPLFLNAKILAEVLGIAPSSAYELMHEKGFPVLKVGNRLLVEKSKFKEWIERNTGG